MRQRLGIVTLIGCLILTSTVGLCAPNKVQLVPGTSLKFADAAQTPAVTFTLTGMTAGGGQYSARYDKNALVSASGAMPYLWRWACSVQLSGTNTPGEVVEVYISTSDGVIAQGNLGTTTAALVTDKRKDLTFAGVLVVDQGSANTSMMAAGYLEIRERYFSLALWNATVSAFKSDTAVHTCYMTPQSVEIQAHAPLDYDNRTAVPALVLAA